MAEILELYKKVGETPLECILRFKSANPLFEEVKMAYLGRLDPMAEGLLLVLTGSGSKEQYFSLDKTYEFEVLWGVETDTYDILGEIISVGKFPEKLEKKMDSLIRKISAKKTQVYPPYSSKAVGGKKLFMWAREGKIEEIDRPERGIKIFSLEHIHTRLTTGQEILADVSQRIALVKGDFRQDKILGLWQKALEDRLDEKFLVSKFSADVSTGTYIRGLAHEMGKAMNTGAIAYGIKRTRVGEYKVG
ncbi:MAG: hypothetical protein WDZ61_00865 [Parcubacteria group bacterium]